MIDFSKYTLQELQAMSDLLDYLREDANGDALSYFCGCSLLQAIKHESLRLSRSILMSLEDQARDAAEPAGDPPAPPDMFGWVGDALDDLCAAGAPPAEDPAEDPAGLRYQLEREKSKGGKRNG